MSGFAMASHLVEALLTQKLAWKMPEKERKLIRPATTVPTLVYFTPVIPEVNFIAVTSPSYEGAFRFEAAYRRGANAAETLFGRMGLRCYQVFT